MGLDMYLKKANGAEVMYWRKANAIHGWLDQHYGPIEDCEDVLIPYEGIKNLVSDIELALKDNSKAEEIIPPTPGFFFGSTEIDEYYWNDLKETRTKLKEVLVNNDPSTTFIYHAWW